MSTKRTMYAYNIYWDIDMDEVYERLDTMPPIDVCNVLKVNPLVYCVMNADQRHGCIYSKFHHSLGLLDEFLGLPEMVRIPEVLAREYRKTKDASYITEYLSDMFGYCINNYNIKDEKEIDKWEL